MSFIRSSLPTHTKASSFVFIALMCSPYKWELSQMCRTMVNFSLHISIYESATISCNWITGNLLTRVEVYLFIISVLFGYFKYFSSLLFMNKFKSFRFSKNQKLTDGYKCKSFKFDYCCKLKICANLNSFLHAFYLSQFVHVFMHVSVNVTKKRVYIKVCLYTNLEVEVYTVRLNSDFLGESTLYQKTFWTLFT